MKYAHAYRRRDDILLHADAQTVAGFWIAYAPMIVASAASPETVGSGVEQVLAASRTGIPAPSFDGTLGRDLLVQARAKSWRELTKASLGLMLELREGELTIKGTDHDRKRTALIHNGRSVVLPLGLMTAEEVGRRVIAAFEMSC